MFLFVLKGLYFSLCVFGLRFVMFNCDFSVSVGCEC